MWNDFVHLICYSQIYLFWLGGRTEDEIVSWVNKKTGRNIKYLESPEEVKDFIDKHHVAVVGFFHDASNELAEAFIAAADLTDDIEFAITSPSASSNYSVVEDKIVVFNKASFLLC